MNEAPPPRVRHERADHWLALVSTVLLALAAVATAWSGYQASQWHGEQALAFSSASASRVESTRASSEANRNVEIDVATFTQWIDARALGRTELADFYRERFRPEFRPAFEAWLATRPLVTPGAPPTPFAMPEYQLEAVAEADALEARAAASAEEARRDIERADDYVLAVVLFATALFFAGISTRLPTPGARAVILGLGCVVFLGTVGWLATFPTTF